MSMPNQSPHGDAIVTPPSTPPTPNDNPLSDVFSDSPPASPTTRPGAPDPSDIPQMRSQHATAGYRDGVSVAKEKSLQSGFDEGYSLGAVFGLKVGQLIGKLEGLVLARRGPVNNADAVDANLAKLFTDARQELALETIFGREWWGEDGLWKYEVKRENESSRDPQITFEDIVNSHPAVAKWQGLVAQEVQASSIHSGKFEGAEWEAGRIC